MKTSIVRRYSFEAAHSLPNVPAGHRCGKKHGHSYRLEVEVAGQVEERSGWIVDFADLDVVVAPLVADLDHEDLNDHHRNPTAEAIARWFFLRISEGIAALDRGLWLVRLELHETARGSVRIEA